MHESAAGVADARKIEPGLAADPEFNAAKARMPWTSATKAIQLICGAFLLPPPLSRIQELDEIPAVNQNRSAIVHYDKPNLDPSPHGVWM